MTSILVSLALGADALPRVVSDDPGSWDVLHAADLDGDGLDELVTADNSNGISIYPNLGGTFAPPVWLDEEAGAFTTFDVDSDGDEDLVFGWSDNDNVYWMENLGALAFAPPLQMLPAGTVDRPQLLAAEDLDGDGDLDLVVSDDRDDELSWFPQVGVGVYGAEVFVGDEVQDLNIDDLDGDGRPDLLVTRWYVDEAGVHWNLAGGFSPHD